MKDIIIQIEDVYTVEPPNKGHHETNDFVPCREVVPISEGPLSEVPLYLVVGSYTKWGPSNQGHDEESILVRCPISWVQLYEINSPCGGKVHLLEVSSFQESLERVSNSKYSV
jgi:hypothetical protein